MTDLVASAWIAVCVYTLLLICIPSGPIIVNDLLVTLVPFAVACAAMERWRWSRVAMLGMSAAILVDVAGAALQVLSTAGGAAMDSARNLTTWKTVFSGFTGDWRYGVCVAGIAVVTAAWLARPAVRREFEFRKRASTRRSQVWIAAAVVALYASGLTGSGLSKHMGTLLLARAEANRNSSLREIALRPESRLSPNGRR